MQFDLFKMSRTEPNAHLDGIMRFDELGTRLFDITAGIVRRRANF